jgi:hypothetical protein
MLDAGTTLASKKTLRSRISHPLSILCSVSTRVPINVSTGMLGVFDES